MNIVVKEVKDLFISGTNVWDIAKLQSLFTPEDIQRILSIRPSMINGQDRIRWKFGSWGTYTVKTGYHIQRLIDMDEQQRQVISTSQTHLRNSMLTKLWRVNIAPKIKIFWWKTLHNGLPVTENLRKRGCKISNLCQICGEEIETIDHMMLQCRVAWKIWSMAINDIGNHLNRGSAVFDLFTYILNSYKEDQKGGMFALMLGWRIWKMRNKLVFENKRDHIIRVIHAAALDMRVWAEASMQNESTLLRVSRPEPMNIYEILPHEAQLYCIVDASWKSLSEKIGIGWSLFSKKGTLRLQGSSAMDATDTPLVAEAVTMWEAVYQLHRLSHKNVTFLGDCLKLIKQLEWTMGDNQHKDNQISEASSTIHDIGVVAKKNQYSFYHVPRRFTSIVDRLAKNTRSNNQSYVISWPCY